MLPSRERFTRSECASFLTQKGLQTVYNRLGTFKFIPASVRQILVVTSSKHEKRAVCRNTLRRRLYSLSGRSTTIFKGVLYVSKQSYIFSYDEIAALHADLYAKASKAVQTHS